jgi:hypothetical protein
VADEPKHEHIRRRRIERKKDNGPSSEWNARSRRQGATAATAAAQGRRTFIFLPKKHKKKEINISET